MFRMGRAERAVLPGFALGTVPGALSPTHAFAPRILIAYRLVVVNGVVANSALARILRRMGSTAGTCGWRSR
jgi:hypothetical protein